MWELDHKESWAPKNWCFWTVVKWPLAFACWANRPFWRRLLRVPWTARRSHQSILKEISAEYSLEGLRLKLKVQYFDHLMWRTDSLEKILMLGKSEDRGKRGRQRMRWLDGIIDWKDMRLSKLMGVGDGQGSPASCSPWGLKESDTTEQLSWTELRWWRLFSFSTYLSRITQIVNSRIDFKPRSVYCEQVFLTTKFINRPQQTVGHYISNKHPDSTPLPWERLSPAPSPWLGFAAKYSCCQDCDCVGDTAPQQRMMWKDSPEQSRVKDLF